MTSRFLQLSGGRICLHEWGEGRHLIIALHGFEGSGRWFARFAGMLPSGYRLVAPDLPWHGRTEWHDPHFSPEQLLELIHLIRRDTHSGSFIALGFSMGARLWFQVALDLQPHLLAGIWIAPDGVASKWGFAMRLAARLPIHRHRTLQSPPYPLYLFIKALSRSALLPLYARQFVQRNFQTAPEAQRVLRTLQMLPHFGKTPAHIRRLLQQSGLPQLVVSGTDDPLIHPSALQRKFRAVPDSAVYLVKKEGHALLRRPEKWAETVFRFADRYAGQ